MSHRKCFKCSKALPGEDLDPHSLCVDCRPDNCSSDRRCNECQHLSESQFKGFVAYLKKGADAKGKKRSKSSGGSEVKRQQVSILLPVVLVKWCRVQPRFLFRCPR